MCCFTGIYSSFYQEESSADVLSMLHMAIFIYYFHINTITFVMCYFDNYSIFDIPEDILRFHTIIGGSYGIAVAMSNINYKKYDDAFKRIYTIIVVIQVLFLIMFYLI
ncbi:MAG: hypothetical protein F6K23_18625 [Okeania sp. SIO2C9]|uniref:hypothetical protein n=1 Tax=Okeania sp. SIO2C9 TaxID=2607791 RepID=UPI0013C1F2CC|nr:hypothetical protein [Okeania sp. SIO2C9]NEQ74877.1 hypothetical protein [Okeania sp. SIO2C9]